MAQEPRLNYLIHLICFTNYMHKFFVRKVLIDASYVLLARLIHINTLNETD